MAVVSTAATHVESIICARKAVASTFIFNKSIDPGSTRDVICMSSQRTKLPSAGVKLSSARHQLTSSSQQLLRSNSTRLCSSSTATAADRPNKANKNPTFTRAVAYEDHTHYKTVEDAVKAIMKEVLQHCLAKECDVMRNKVLDQMAKGLAALSRVTVSTVAAETNVPALAILSTVEDDDLINIQKMLELTSLPFGSASDIDYKHLMVTLQSGDSQGPLGRMKPCLMGSELSQIFKRLGTDVFQCVSPLAMCFPELPFWAKYRAILLPAELAAKVAIFLTSP